MINESIKRKYQNDPMFYRFVQSIFACVMDGQITRQETIEAMAVLDELIANAKERGVLPKHRKTETHGICKKCIKVVMKEIEKHKENN